MWVGCWGRNREGGSFELGDWSAMKSGTDGED